MKQNLTEIEKRMRSIRDTALFKGRIPMEARTGWPVPIVKKGKVYASFILFTAGFQDMEGKIEAKVLNAPSYFVTVDWRLGEFVEFVDLAYKYPDWAVKKGAFPHEAIARMGRMDYMAKREAVFAMYDVLFGSLVDKLAVPDQWLQDFSEKLSELFEPFFQPFYSELYPHFTSNFIKLAKGND